MRARFSQLLRDESGATAIEYAMIAGLISISIVGGLLIIGPKLFGYLASAGGPLK